MLSFFLKNNFRARQSLSLLVLTLLVSSPSFAWAQAEKETESDAPKLHPVLICNVASVERCLSDLSQMFHVAGRPDMMEVVEEFLKEKAGDLKGLDRTRPLGLLVFLEQTLPPRPRLVLYLPVSNEADLITTLRLGPAPITEVTQHEYRIENSGSHGKTPLLVRNDYAFLLPTGNEFLQGQAIPNPLPLTRELSSRYDVAISLVLRAVPPLIQEVFSTFVTEQFTAQMQQRDNEQDAAYQVRRAQSLSSMKWLEQLIRDGKEVTLGLNSTENGRKFVAELTIQARPDSEFAHYLTGIASKPSYFAPLLSSGNPLQLAVSWNMDAREEEAALGHLDALRTGLKNHLPKESAAAVDKLTDSLGATAMEKHIDGIVQFVSQPNQELVLIGGLKIIRGKMVAAALQQIVTDLGAHDSNVTVQIDQHQHRGTTVHRLTGKEGLSRQSAMYGRKPDLYVGVGSNVLWFAFGGDRTLSVLDAAIDKTLAATPTAMQQPYVPFRASLHAEPWLKYSSEKDRNSDRGILVQKALGAGNDALQLEVRPIESGGRASLTFDEGYVQLFGTLLAQLYDKS